MAEALRRAKEAMTFKRGAEEAVGGVGNSAKLASHHVQNLTFQLQDMVVGLASGQKPMTVLMQQGTQIGGIMQQSGLGVAGFTRAILGMAAASAAAMLTNPYLLAIAAAALAAFGAFKMFQSEVDKSGELQKYAAGLGLTKKEMKELGPVGITAGDTMRGLWKTISDGLNLNEVFAKLKEWMGQAMSFYLDVVLNTTAGIYAAFVGTFNGLKVIFNNFGAIAGDLFTQMANYAISAVEGLINKVINGVNALAGKANGILETVGISARFGTIETVELNRVTNQYAGAASNAAAAISDGYSSAFAEARAAQDAFFADLKANTLEAARERLRNKANEIIGDRSGRQAGQSDAEKEFERRVKASQDYIASLDQQRAALGLNTIQLKELEIATKAAEAPTADLAQRIREQGAALIEAMRAQQVSEFIKNRIEPLEFENRLLAMNAEQRAIATAERELEAAQIARGSEAWNRYIAAVTAGVRAAHDEFDAFMGMTADIDLEGVFGNAGKAFGGILNSLDQMVERQTAYNKAVEEAHGDEVRLAQIRQQQGRLQINTYGNLISSAKGFFKEGSKGYKALQAAETAFRAVELALAIKNAAVKIGLIGATTAAKVTSDTTMAASDTARTAVEQGNSLATSVVKGVEAVINAIRSMPFPLNIAAGAATAAVVASLGIAVGGMFGGGKSNKPVYNEGKGSVFGDAEAQSESIKKSIELLADVDTMTMRYSAQMASSLRNIENNIGGLTNLLIRTTGMEDSAAGVQTGTKLGGALGVLNKTMTSVADFIGGKTGSTIAAGIGFALGGPIGAAIGFLGAKLLGGIGKAIGSVVNALFGTKTSIVGQGISGGPQSIADILGGGFDAQYFTDIKKKKKFFGITTSTSYSTKYSPASDEVNRQFSLIFEGFYDAISAAAGPLGLSLNDVQNRLNNFVVNIGKIDLKGLKGDEIQEKLTAVFGAAADSMARAAIPGLDEFQKVGEGYFETVVRVASGIEQAQLLLRQLGVDAINYQDIINKQGDVAAEIIRQSVVLYDKSVGVAGGFADIVNAFDGTGQELYDLILQLREMQRLLAATGKAAETLTVAMISGAGGAQALADGLNTYFEEFLSSAEQQASLAKRMAQSFAALGLAVPADVDAFKALVNSIDTTTEAGQTLFGQLMALVPAFNDMISAVDEAVQAEAKAADELRNAWQGIEQDVADAEAALRAAYKREADVLKATADRFKKLGDSLRSFAGEVVSLNGGGAASLDTLRKKFAETVTLAKLGNEQAMSDLPGVGKDLRDAVIANASDRTSMMLQLYAIQRETLAAAEVSDNHVSIAQEQLDALTEQVSSLIELNETALTVQQAIEALSEAQDVRDNALAQITAAGFADLIAVTEKTNAQLVTLAIEAIKAAQASQADLAQASSDALAQAAADAAAQAAAEAAAQAAAQAAMPDGYAEWLANLQAYSPTVQDTEQLRALYNNLQNGMGYASIYSGVPMFADGGAHSGGWRIVGERGPELEYTGPSRIYDANTTKSMLNNDDLKDEMSRLRNDMKYALFTIAKNTGKTSDQLTRWDGDGMPPVRDVA